LQFHIIKTIQRLFRHFLKQSYHGVERVNCTGLLPCASPRSRDKPAVCGSATVIINVIASPLLPTPTGVTFVTTTTSLPDNSPAGTAIATFSVSMSDGSSFAGTLGASPTGTVAISGSTRLVLARALTSADDGSQQWMVIATQNEMTVSSSISVQVIPLSPPPPLPPLMQL
jgi:hypothetical protein